MTTKKAKAALIARQEMRYQDAEGDWHVVHAGQKVPRDHFLVAVHPTMWFVASHELVALEELTAYDAEGNARTVAKGETLAPDDPFIDLHPGMVGRPIYEFEEEES